VIRSSRCENCGALASSGARCRYCGATVLAEDLVAAGFGDGEDSFVAMRDAQGVRVTALGAHALRVEVPPETEVGPAVVGCAWTRGSFVDLDVSVAIRFELAAEGIAAGIWLRSSTAAAVCVMLTPDGKIAATTRRDHIAQLGGIGAPAGLRFGEPIVLRAKIQGALLTIHRNGIAAMSVACPTDLTGGADLVVEVPARERGAVVFEDVCATLPRA
jgi:hypothetical protein